MAAGERAEPRYALEDLERIKQVGKGAKSQVWLVKHKPSAEYLCLKEIARAHVRTQEEAQHVWNERTVLTELSEGPAPFLRCCRLHATLKDDKAVYFLMEFISGAPLHHHFQAARGFGVERTRFYTAELVETISTLHERGVIYRDLKASNVMLDAKSGRLRLVDFGFAKKLDGPEPVQLRRTASVCGTFHAMAPEVRRQDGVPVEDRPGYTPAADWWSLGVLVFEMLTATAPFGYRGDDLDARARASPGSLAFPADMDGQTREFISRLLEPEAAARLGYGGANDVRCHPWFDGFDWPGAAVDLAGGASGSLEAPSAVPSFDDSLGEFASFESVDLHAEIEGDPFEDSDEAAAQT